MRKQVNKLLARLIWWSMGGGIVSAIYWVAINHPYLACLWAGVLAVELVLALSRYMDRGRWTRVRRVGDVSIQERWERKN